MDPHEDAIFCRYCYHTFSEPEAELPHLLECHKHAPEVQGLTAPDNLKRCTLCVSNYGVPNAKTFASQNALDSHMDRVHQGWKASYPQCLKKNCHKVFLSKEDLESHKPVCGKE